MHRHPIPGIGFEFDQQIVKLHLTPCGKQFHSGFLAFPPVSKEINCQAEYIAKLHVTPNAEKFSSGFTTFSNNSIEYSCYPEIAKALGPSHGLGVRVRLPYAPAGDLGPSQAQ